MSGNARLLMICDDLRTWPRCDLPPGYRLKWFARGDEAAWLRIHELADRFTALTPDLFREKFGGDDVLLGRRQVFALDSNGLPVGTVTAWEGEFEGERTGRVHWLAVVPEHQGKGLGRALISSACCRLMEEGFTKAYIVTGQARIEAIRLYSSFGFVPVRRNEQERRLWEEIGAVPPRSIE